MLDEYHCAMRVVNVTFISKSQRANPRLTFPKKVAALLGVLTKTKKVALIIRKTSGEILFADTVPLRSGTEIYGAAKVRPALKKLKQGEEIWVEAWRPK
jgi:hypothetical protein